MIFSPKPDRVEIRYLTLHDFVVIASRVLDLDRRVVVNLVDPVLADSALHAPQAGLGDIDAYPGFATKVGVLGFRITMNHALPDGNKRTAYLAMVEFVERHGFGWAHPSPVEVRDVMLAAAAGRMSEVEFVAWVEQQIIETTEV